MIGVSAPGFTPILDEPWRWADDSSWRRPIFDVKAFQAKIDEIVGLTVRGDSIVRLQWMRDMECYEKRYTAWDSVGTPIKHELRATYKFVTVPIEGGDIIDIPPPRWVLEQRYEPEQIAEAWEKERWETEDGIARPLKDAVPGNGYYKWLWTVASHNNCCEEGVITDEHGSRVCWGRYRKPGEKDLTTLRAMMFRKRQDGLIISPFEHIDPAIEDKVVRRQLEFDRVEDNKKKEITRDVINDAIAQNLWKYTDDPGVLKNGKYHFQGANAPKLKGKKENK